MITNDRREFWGSAWLIIAVSGRKAGIKIKVFLLPKTIIIPETVPPPASRRGSPSGRSVGNSGRVRNRVPVVSYLHKSLKVTVLLSLAIFLALLGCCRVFQVGFSFAFRPLWCSTHRREMQVYVMLYVCTLHLIIYMTLCTTSSVSKQGEPCGLLDVATIT